ncbi:MAG: hypothetical protein IJ468_04555 [Lachnospiraceae bacterium]|nr:hypothetical protein [Lachnospiraceae bacterium]
MGVAVSANAAVVDSGTVYGSSYTTTSYGITATCSINSNAGVYPVVTAVTAKSGSVVSTISNSYDENGSGAGGGSNGGSNSASVVYSATGFVYSVANTHTDATSGNQKVFTLIRYR